MSEQETGNEERYSMKQPRQTGAIQTQKQLAGSEVVEQQRNTATQTQKPNFRTQEGPSWSTEFLWADLFPPGL
ncbi:hypothetical protein E2C01_036201 [Portunus trituberculatus]|uniref:Uncharacterized protein n=1 Tax=Portunus trituberculatus TaxID=210409 RepID=A0A5B7FBF0_PORTR|nr:hypothetical protein [Portunus trituberculatus]